MRFGRHAPGCEASDTTAMPGIFLARIIHVSSKRRVASAALTRRYARGPTGIVAHSVESGQAKQGARGYKGDLPKPPGRLGRSLVGQTFQVVIRIQVSGQPRPRPVAESFGKEAELPCSHKGEEDVVAESRVSEPWEAPLRWRFY